MFFKNLQLYTLTSPFILSAEELHDKLIERQHETCKPNQAGCFGWFPPAGEYTESLTHAANGCIMICTKREQKILPPQTINEELKLRITTIEDAEGRTIRGKERARLKDEVTFDLLPRAFSKATITYAYIDLKNSWLVIDSPSANRAEELISLLRDCLGSLPITPMMTNKDPSDALTSLMDGSGAIHGVTLQGDCDLQDPLSTGSVIKCKGQDLSSDEALAHIKAGMYVSKLALEMDDSVSLTLCDDMAIKKLKFLDVVQEKAAEIETDDQLARFDADFSIMAGEIDRLINGLASSHLFGGIHCE
jgi:recombination associated protein RdgC